MKLTFNEAIANHRKMWNWIADKSEERKRVISKADYFAENKIKDYAFENCYACEYGIQQIGYYQGSAKCDKCPIDWGVENCEAISSPYYDWRNSEDYQSAAKYAREIANLPSREEVRNI